MPVHVLASIRQVVFEAQTLLISQVRAMLEKKDDDAKTELAPAERASRIRDQESRMKGLSLQGEAMCSHASYDIVMKVVEQNTLSYLSPSKFASRQSELRLEKPKKTLEISSGSVRVADQREDRTCAVQAHEAILGLRPGRPSFLSCPANLALIPDEAPVGRPATSGVPEGHRLASVVCRPSRVVENERAYARPHPEEGRW